LKPASFAGRHSLPYPQRGSENSPISLRDAPQNDQTALTPTAPRGYRAATSAGRMNRPLLTLSDSGCVDVAGGFPTASSDVSKDHRGPFTCAKRTIGACTFNNRILMEDERTRSRGILLALLCPAREVAIYSRYEYGKRSRPQRRLTSL